MVEHQPIIAFGTTLFVTVVFWLVLYFGRKNPKPETIEQWPLRFIDFKGGPDKFNALVDSFLSKRGYKLRFREANGVYFTEAFFKWNRMGLCYYIYLDEARKLVIVHYRTYSTFDEATTKAVKAVLSHFA